MKSFLLFLFASLCTGNSFSQATKLRFEYDSAGNQTLRTLCINCQQSKEADTLSVKNQSTAKETIADVMEEVISFYPNPVKEELFLKWKLANDKKVSEIVVFNINGQVIKAIKNVEQFNSKNISFQEYPAGTYLVNLYYTNGDNKSITILKK